MRLLNYQGRAAVLVGPGEGVDVEAAFGADLGSIYDRWSEFRSWLPDINNHPRFSIEDDDIGPPVPAPRQVFAVGLNYRDHAEEGGLGVPDEPMIFTKFPASVTGPFADIELPSDAVDFESELVVVIGCRAYRVPEALAWDYVAGLTGGQDLSERRLQTSGAPPQQFSLAKSFSGFAPIGPYLVTPDELDDPNDIGLGCRLNGRPMQADRTRNMIFSVAQLVAYLSAVLPLLPGDLIFTGTPSGIGWTRDPQVTLSAGDQLVTEFDGIGSMRNHFIAKT
ncbi:fumarylacetoacetate hydrolase family protein [Mycobacterium sp.]|uniref:fumarylacetoacetate hydrolase family protein n=1 Tax=Mycobacterium sp. TaxID=1785 RepID=UPI003D0DC4B0